MGKVYVGIVSLLLVSLAFCANTRTDDVLFNITIFPSRIKGTSWPIGFIGTSANLSASIRFSAMRFAVYYINTYTNLIPNVSFDFYAANVNRSRTNALLASLQMIKYNKIRSILGATTDTEADATAILANDFKVPQIASYIQSAGFADKTNYPYFLRIIPPYSAQANIITTIMDKYNWPNISLVTSTDTYGNDAGVYMKLGKEYVVYPFVVNPLSADYISKVKLMQSSQKKSRLVALFCSFSVGIKFLQSLYDIGLINNNSVYIMSQEMTLPLIDNPELLRNYTHLFDGAIGMVPYGGEGDLYEQVKQLWNTADSLVFPGKRPPYDRWWYDFEAIYSQAVAIGKLQRPSEVPGNEFYEMMRNGTYEGVTGTVSFDKNGDRRGNWSIVNFVKGTVEVRAKFVYPSTLVEFSNITFYGNMSTIPVVYTNNATVVLIPSSLGREERTAFSILIALCVLFALASQVILLFKRSDFQRNGPVYCGIIIFGVGVGIFTAATLLWPRTPSLCMLFPWLLAFAFDLVYGCLFIKVWVLYSVYRQAANFQPTNLSPYHVMKVLGVVMFLDAIFMSIWTVKGYPVVYTAILWDKYTEPRCQYPHLAFWIVFSAIKALWLLAGAVLAFITRGIAKNFSEAKSIGYAIYHNICVGLICFPIGMAIGPIPNGPTIVLIAVLLEVFTLTLAILFVPIWYRIFWAPRDVFFNISKRTSLATKRSSARPSSPLSQSSSTSDFTPSLHSLSSPPPAPPPHRISPSPPPLSLPSQSPPPPPLSCSSTSSPASSHSPSPPLHSPSPSSGSLHISSLN